MGNYFNKVMWRTKNKDYWKTVDTVQYRVWTSSKVLYVAYQQTEGIEDLKVDFNFWTRSKDGVNIHRGVSRAFEKSKANVIQDIFAELRKSDVEEIVIIGWSLGGAYASLLCKEIDGIFNLKVSAYTYGCPRLLFMPSKKALDKFKNVTNIVGKNDLVTLSPIFYKRGGRDILLDNMSTFPNLAVHDAIYYSTSEI